MSGDIPSAYSRLGAILAQENLSVLALQRRLEVAGVPVNIKSLYRLAEAGPLRKIDLRMAAAICKVCAVPIGELITFERPQAQLRRLGAREQSRLDALMDRNNDGKLTAAERREFLALAEQAHQLSLANARLLIAGRRRAGRRLPSARKRRVPVAA